ncbi:hypothetical protein V6N11_035550 [Hibiscus sabdariffa]|uniref:Uncharacterized protein n=1 Tax=Hibiscus sabdariffa TaxID=183260 RepID=A0ABR2R0V7_9ROSI
MDQARLVYCSFGIDSQCFYFFYKGASIFCFDWMTNGMSQLETTGPALADYLGWKSNLGRAGDENTEAPQVIRQEESEVQEEAQEEEGREEVLTTNPTRGQTADTAAKPVPT